MADFYCDHGCTLYPTAYMSVPTGAGSFPQEGDGLAPGNGTAPAVSVATMDFTPATAAAGATFAVHGATLTCVASGASTIQFNAGSGSTLASNLATAINAATAVPTVTTGGLSSPYLKALVWAVASGAVLTVYSRIASAALNQSSNASCTLICGTTANWTSPPATANFSGGVSGPWAHFFNTTALTVAISASISAAGSYGAFVATMMGYPVAGDRLIIRSGRSGSDIVCATPTTTVTIDGRSVGTLSSYLEVMVDNGVIWSGDNNVFTVRHSTATQNCIIRPTGYTYFRGKMQAGENVHAGGVPNFKFQFSGTNAYRFALNVTPLTNRNTVVDTLDFIDTTSTNSPGMQLGSGASPPYGLLSARQINCRFTSNNSTYGGPYSYFNSYGCAHEAFDCLFSYGNVTQLGAIIPSVPQGNVAVKLVRPKFTGGNGGHHVLVAALSSSISASSATLVIEDPVDMGQFIASDSAASFCGRSNGSTNSGIGSSDMAFGQFIAGGREFLIDTPRRLLEYRAAAFPTTGLSTFPDGTPFSVRFSLPHTGLASGLVSKANPVRGLKQVITNTLGSGNLILTEHTLIDALFGGAAYTATESEWWIEGAYVGTDGLTKTFSTREVGGSVSADTQSWSALTYTPFAGGQRTYNRWKMTTTLSSVLDDTEVIVWLVSAKQPSLMTEWCFIDPHFQLVLS